MKRLLPLAVLAAAAAAMPATSQAAPTYKAEVLGPIVSHGETADVKVHYVCQSGDMLWISAKQMGDTKPDQRLRGEGSSMAALTSGGAWLDSHRNPITCNGKWQTQTFTVDTLERSDTDWEGNPIPMSGPLKKGQAWFQFCVTDSTAGEGPEALTLSESGWTAVK